MGFTWSIKPAGTQCLVRTSRRLGGFKESLAAHSVLENNLKEINLSFYGNDEVILQYKHISLQSHITGAKE